MKLLIVSGLSGSGKSIALHALEDAGYYCVDNLPVSLLPSFIKEVQQNEQNYYEYSAISIDARSSLEQIQHVPKILGALKSRNVEIEVLFLYANEETLLKRFNETRRKHPLTHFNRPLLEAIKYESDMLNSIVGLADFCIDSSEKTPTELRALIQRQLTAHSFDTKYKITLLFQSFGFKYGIPSDTSFVFDARCLPNPHWESNLRLLTGRDYAVKKFFESQPTVKTMIQDIHDFLNKWIPIFESENRHYMTVSIGCTGGQHRSVYIAEKLAHAFKRKRNNISLRHRALL